MQTRVIAGAAFAVFAIGGAHAQSFPSKSVRIIVPYAAGGGTDLNARPVAQKLTDRWGQTVVVDNRPGGNAMIGTELVARSAPDGYTLLFHASSEIVTNVSLFKKIPYDPVKDFTPITLASTTAVIIVTHPSLPVKSMKELVALSRGHPGTLPFASVGTGSPQHLAGELLNTVAKTDLAHIPFKGAAPALIDVLGGHVPVGFIALLPTVPHVKAGKLVALAVTTKERSSALPQVPTTAEVGYPGVDLYQWYGVLAPAGTSREVTDRLVKDFIWALTLPEIKERFSRDGCDVVANTPQEFAVFIKSEIEKNARVIKVANVRGE